MIKLPISYTIELTRSILDQNIKIQLKEQAISEQRQQFCDYINQNDQSIYGLNTFLGRKDSVKIQNLQEYESKQLSNIFKSEQIEKYLSYELTRVTLFVVINNLCQSFSGVSVETIQQLIDCFNNDNKDMLLKLPADHYNSQYYDATVNWHMIRDLKLLPYEAILITSMKSLSYATLLYSTFKATECMKFAYIATAISFEANNGVICAYTQLVNEVKQHEGQKEVAKELYEMLTIDDQTSKLNQSLKSVTHNILQDAYSLRCTPQVLGASLDQIKMIVSELEKPKQMSGYKFIMQENKLQQIIYNEQNNNEEEIVLGDYLCIAISEIGAISERRIQRTMNPNLNKLQNYYEEFLRETDQEYGLQKMCNLASNLIQKNKKECHPSSNDSMPQTTYLEDINNNFEESVVKLDSIVRNTLEILAIDLYVSTRVIKKLEEKEKRYANDKMQKIIEAILKFNSVSQIVESMNHII